jgi:hypothetical protein
MTDLDREPALPLRMALKKTLMLEAKGKLICPFCVYRVGLCLNHTASQLHEIFCPTIKGGKYAPKPDDPVSAAVYVLENVILMCPECNVNWVNSQPRAWVMAIKMSMPGYSPERCIPKLMDLAKTQKYPEYSVIPHTLFTVDGREFKLNFKLNTYTEIEHAPQESSSTSSA